jgi:lysyl-tRNA synthetase class 2
MPEPGADLLVARRRKLEALRARGVPLYPNDFRPTATTADIRRRFGDLPREALPRESASFRLAGRIMTARDFGKASFFHLQDRTGRLQVYVRQDELGKEGMELYRLSDLGDIVGVEGTLFRTRTGELTLLARRFQILAKALRPLPEKWHGLSDTETRYRQRYLDLLVNPEVVDVFRKRAAILHAIRRFFVDRGFLEVETPAMQPIAGGAAARPFVTHHNALGLDLYLRIAPELYLKRLIVGGLERVFEIARVFRNEGLSTRHNPEFTILEFYVAYADYRDLMELTEELFLAIASEVVGGTRLRWGEHEIDLERPWRRVTLREALREHTGASLEDLADIERLRRLAAAKGVSFDPRWGPGKLLLELFEKLVEPHLVQPTFVVGYPLEVSPLARRSDSDPETTDRFELYIGGRELANAFSELNDPDDQRARFEAQARARAAGDEEAQPMDEDFLVALEHGMCPTAGEGIGIDRLVMLFANQPSIRDVMLFPLLRPER